jgi:hypothetical protein
MLQRSPAASNESRSIRERGIVTALLLFAMCAFAVLSIAALSTAMGSAPVGQSYGIFRSIEQDALTKFIATFVVPNNWKVADEKGVFQFQLPVIVPEGDSDDASSSAAWHTMTEVPGMAVCCEGRDGICRNRKQEGGGAPIADWTPAADDAMWLSFDMASQPDPDTKPLGELVTATVTQSPDAAADGVPVACQLEFNNKVIAKATAVLRQVPRQPDSGLSTPVVAGAITLAVRQK